MLSQKQEDFCWWYVKLKNGNEAAIKAGYSEKTARKIASENLTKGYIVNKIKEIQEERRKANEVTHERLEAEYKKIAFVNFADVMKYDMTFEDIKKLPRRTSAAIKAVTISETVTQFGTTTNVKVELHSKEKSLDALSKHTGFFEKDNKQKRPVFKVGFKKKEDE